MVINVTQEDIEIGIKKSSSRCPIARALMRIFPGNKVRVGFEDILIYNSYGLVNRYKSTKNMKRFMNSFDHGKPVKPSRFIVK